MYERVLVFVDGRVPAGGLVSPPAQVHRNWLGQRLAETPASLQDLTLQQVPEGTLAMEWQAVFKGAGVAYFRLAGVLLASCLLLEGRNSVSESAAIDGLQQTLQLKKAAGFDHIRRTRGRPMRAMVLLQEPPRPEITDTMVYWADCLAVAYFGELAGPTNLGDGDGLTMRAV